MRRLTIAVDTLVVEGLADLDPRALERAFTQRVGELLEAGALENLGRAGRLAVDPISTGDARAATIGGAIAESLSRAAQ